MVPVAAQVARSVAPAGYTAAMDVHAVNPGLLFRGGVSRRRAACLVSLLLCTAAALGGCASQEFKQSGLQTYPPYEGEVTQLDKLPAPGSYILLGVVVVRGVALTGNDEMYEQLKEQAAARGADAVVPQGKIKDRPTHEGGEQRRLAGYAILRNR
jgi:hypothetical protein